MQRCLQRAAILTLATLAFASSTYASSLSYTSTFDPTDVYFSKNGGACTGSNFEDSTPDTVSGQTASGCSELDFQHLLDGYVVPGDTLLSATLDLYFHDDSDPSNSRDGNPESVTIVLDQGSLDELQLGEMLLLNSSATTLHYNVFAQLLDTNLLQVTLGLGQQGFGQNDFYFLRSELTASWSPRSDDDAGEASVAVPEPASLLLLGGGIAAAFARRRLRK